MTAIDIARRMAQLGETAEALRAYAIALSGDAEPQELLEAALYTLEHRGERQLAFTSFVGLYGAGFFREELLPLLIKEFLEPALSQQKKRYQRNITLLRQYPYCFQKDFPAFDDLPLRFFPYDSQDGYVPFECSENEFLGFVNVKEPVISQNFFGNLEQPIIASEVYSQYELEYLHDAVRPSEWAGRENHIYLHYKDWETFCAWLSVLTMRPILNRKQVVFLFGEERSQYPIDFKARFGIDYTRYHTQPFHIREINRLILHTQLSSHNGGDFFNEVFDGHPNLMTMASIMFDNVMENVALVRRALSEKKDTKAVLNALSVYFEPRVAQELYTLKNWTDKDILVAFFLGDKYCTRSLDPKARIAPIIFFQPHFAEIRYWFRTIERGDTMLLCDQMDQLCGSEIICGFKYVKTFTPLRRFTTSYGATVKFSHQSALEKNGVMDDAQHIYWRSVVDDAVSVRVLNRSYLRDSDERLYRDAVVVRFEDAKLNPKATFTRLTAFLDLPYTESMNYCTLHGEQNPESMKGNDRGFDPAAVYRTYDEYANDNERRYIEFFLRDAYTYYGYDFLYYDGGPVDFDQVQRWINGFDTINKYMSETYQKLYKGALEEVFVKKSKNIPIQAGALERKEKELLSDFMRRTYELRIKNSKILLRGLHFVNKRGQPLEFTPMLQPDPELLEQPLYH